MHAALPVQALNPISSGTASLVLTPAGWARLPPYDVERFLFDVLPRPLQVTAGIAHNSSWRRVLDAPLYYGGLYLPVYLTTGDQTVVTRADLQVAQVQISARVLRLLTEARKNGKPLPNPGSDLYEKVRRSAIRRWVAEQGGSAWAEALAALAIPRTLPPLDLVRAA